MKFLLLSLLIILNAFAYPHYIYEWKHDANVHNTFGLFKFLLLVFLIYTSPLLLLIVIIAIS